jgi:hypothetical protein
VTAAAAVGEYPFNNSVIKSAYYIRPQVDKVLKKQLECEG